MIKAVYRQFSTGLRRSGMLAQPEVMNQWPKVVTKQLSSVNAPFHPIVCF
jgi:hypothetical protein